MSTVCSYCVQAITKPSDLQSCPYCDDANSVFHVGCIPIHSLIHKCKGRVSKVNHNIPYMTVGGVRCAVGSECAIAWSTICGVNSEDVMCAHCMKVLFTDDQHDYC